MIPHWKEKAPPPVSTNMNIITPPQKCWSIIAMFHHNNKYLLVWYYLCKFVCMCLHAFFHLSIYLPQSLSTVLYLSVFFCLFSDSAWLSLPSLSVRHLSILCLRSFITEIYIAPIQGYYSEALLTLAQPKR